MQKKIDVHTKNENWEIILQGTKIMHVRVLSFPFTSIFFSTKNFHMGCIMMQQPIFILLLFLPNLAINIIYHDAIKQYFCSKNSVYSSELVLKEAFEIFNEHSH
jgi:hypothetical protein